MSAAAPNVQGQRIAIAECWTRGIMREASQTSSNTEQCERSDGDGPSYRWRAYARAHASASWGRHATPAGVSTLRNILISTNVLVLFALTARWQGYKEAVA